MADADAAARPVAVTVEEPTSSGKPRIIAKFQRLFRRTTSDAKLSGASTGSGTSMQVGGIARLANAGINTGGGIAAPVPLALEAGGIATVEPTAAASTAAPTGLLLPMATLPMARAAGGAFGSFLFQLRVSVAAINSRHARGTMTTPAIYLIRVQYGNTPFTWIIRRRLRDFMQLHSRLRLLQIKRAQGRLPHFPRLLDLPGMDTHAAREHAAYTENIAEDDARIAAQPMTFHGPSSPSPGAAHDRRGQIAPPEVDRLTVDLCTYLTELLHGQLCEKARRLLCEFLECSSASFNPLFGPKGKEMFVYVCHTRSRNPLAPLLRRIQETFRLRLREFDPAVRRARRRWLVVRSNCVVLFDSLDASTPSRVILVDRTFDVLTGRKATKSSKGVIVRSLSAPNGSLRLQTIHTSSARELALHLQALKASLWASQHRFDSFFPQREKTRVVAHVDGAAYFDAVADALESAQRTIFIADWWLSPELYLKRPPSRNHEWRLDRVLRRKAAQGVRIFVLLYKEFPNSMIVESLYAKRTLQALHPTNVLVQRHPDHVAPSGTLYWAHHEKIVAIDSERAFIGGIDLCFGRYDTTAHNVSDIHARMFPGKDYSNPYVKDFFELEQYDRDGVDRLAVARMPWHDVGMEMTGAAASDVARHFVERWNYIKTSKAEQDPSIPFLEPEASVDDRYPPPSPPPSDAAQRPMGTSNVQIVRSAGRWSSDDDVIDSSLYKAYIEAIRGAEHFIYIENQFFVSNAVGPSSDAAALPVRNAIAAALVERIARAHAEQRRFRVIVVLPLKPAFAGDISEAGASASLRIILRQQSLCIGLGPQSLLGQLKTRGIDPDEYICFVGLRSWGLLADRAPAGFGDVCMFCGQPCGAACRTLMEERADMPDIEVEHVVDAKEATDDAAQNQVESQQDVQQDVQQNDTQVEQEVEQEVEEEVTQESVASQPQQQQAVPEHQQQQQQQAVPEHQQQQHDQQKVQQQEHQQHKHHLFHHHEHQQHEQHQHKHHLLHHHHEQEQQPQAVPQQQPVPQQPQTTQSAPQLVPTPAPLGAVTDIHSMLTVATLAAGTAAAPAAPLPPSAPGVPVSEIVYVHTKLMIVDDRLVIMGSANINDRSMHGGRDSEIAAVIEDEDMVESVLDGQPVRVGRFAYDLRMRLFAEHLGIPLRKARKRLQDPVSDRVFRKRWREYAESNSRIFRDVFNSLPDKNLRTWEQYKQRVAQPVMAVTDPGEAIRRLGGVRGHVVEMDVEFLCDEDLMSLPATAPENFLPLKVFI